jgi:FtsH-binding integral membrane protein
MFSIMLLCFGIGLIFWKNSTAQLVYACLGAFLFSIYIIFDTQLIVGRHTFSYSLDDAYFAAINLYLDIINLFLFILQILGRN